MKTVLTALQPSGFLHIGNYFGAIKPFVESQAQNQTNLLFAVDYHAITVPQNPEQLRRNILFATAVYLAAGVDPKKTILFQQSQVPQHTELAWILNCMARMGELERMTQYKDKALGKGQNVSVGLFAYPILMAADILLYDTTHVPVGEDQKQHVELARDLAERFNKIYGPTFAVPEPVMQKFGARIMGLDDPTKKMSKSASSPKNYLSLMDDDKTLEKKIKSAVTDSGTEIRADKERPAMTNLLTIFSLLTGVAIKDLEKRYIGKGYGEFKADLAAAAIDWIHPLRERIQTHLADEAHLIGLLREGAKKAETLAEKKMKEVRERIGVML